MAKIKRGYTRKEPYIPKASPHKDIPVLGKEQKMPDRPRKSKRGSRYRSASLSTFHKGERIIANAENKPKRSGPKISKIRKAFARVPLAAFRLGGGGGGGAGRK
jgi:hypothetical protein